MREGCASRARSAANVLCSLRLVTSCLWWARWEWRSWLYTQLCSLLPQESGGPRPGSQDKLFPSHDSRQVWGVYHQDTETPPIPDSTGPLCCHCRAPPEVGLLRARVLMPGCRAPVGGIPSVCTQMCLAHCQTSCPVRICSQRQRDQGRCGE